MGLRRLIQKIKLRYGSQETVIKTLREMGMRVGEHCRVYTLRMGSEPWLIRLGNRVLVAPDVTFVTHGAAAVFEGKHKSLVSFGKIDIKDNVHIGVNVTILPNVTIGPNAVIGAGSVVTRDVPPNTVVAGNPARPICSLEAFEEKCLANHIDIPKDRDAARKVLERHFWGEDA